MGSWRSTPIGIHGFDGLPDHRVSTSRRSTGDGTETLSYSRIGSMSLIIHASVTRTISMRSPRPSLVLVGTKDEAVDPQAPARMCLRRTPRQARLMILPRCQPSRHLQRPRCAQGDGRLASHFAGPARPAISRPGIAPIFAPTPVASRPLFHPHQRRHHDHRLSRPTTRPNPRTSCAGARTRPTI